jgi:hypothetical protein
MNNNLEFEHNLITRLVFKKENNVIWRQYKCN